eukprot:1151888-Prymnesium_polylepis.1
MGVAGKPFRTQMLKWGAAASELDGPGYAAARWADPDGLVGGKNSARPRAEVAAGAGARAAGVESVQGGVGSRGVAQASTAGAGDGAMSQQGREAGMVKSRKRGGADAA